MHAGILELVQLLQKRGTAVALVSGGFRQIIEPIAASLGIPTSHVHANLLLFEDDGSYSGAVALLALLMFLLGGMHVKVPQQ